MIKGVPYDAEIAFLESTGTQYVNTGIVSTGFGIRADVVCAQTQSGGEMGIVGRTQSGGFELYTNYNQSKVGIWNRSGNNIELSRRLALSQVYSISAEITSSLITLSIDGDVTTKAITPASFTNGYILVFSHGISYVFKGRVYSCKIWQDGVLVRDFIPVRVGTTGYLYDRVTRRLFGNAGTGAFTLGPDVATPVMSLHRMAERSVA